jgi:hypothetical protein
MTPMKDDRLARAAEYRIVAELIRELAKLCRFCETKKALYELAFRYDRAADDEVST